MPTLSSLPGSLLSSILEFALPGFSLSVGRRQRILPLKRLKNVALVSKRMLRSVRGLVEEYRASTFCLNMLDLASPLGIAAIQRTIKTRGSKVCDLRLQCGGAKKKKHRFEPLENSKVDWNAIFEFVPGLKRLDLGELSLQSHHIPDLLRTASTHCLYLEFLLLPEKNGFPDSDERAAMESFTTAMTNALVQWFFKGHCEGLRQLTIPVFNEEGFFREFMDAIVQFCPRIDTLQACRSVRRPPTEKWLISLDMWRAFNASCPNLCEFDWAVVPFADTFFRVFGEIVKPQLTTLILSSNATRDNNQYSIEHIETNGALDLPASRSGYGSLARDTNAVLKGCPALTKLVITVGNGDVDVDAYGDTFWEEVAGCCPLLESIEMVGSTDCTRHAVGSILPLTGFSLLALACLKRLSVLTLGPARFTGNAIFQYLRLVSKVGDTIGRRRTISLTVAGYDPIGMPDFYSEILELLTLLSEESEESLGAATCLQRPVVHLRNPHLSTANSIWYDGYLSGGLRPVVKAVKQTHPSLGVAVFIHGRDGDEFKRIERLTLDWNQTHTQVFFDEVERH